MIAEVRQVLKSHEGQTGLDPSNGQYVATLPVFIKQSNKLTPTTMAISVRLNPGTLRMAIRRSLLNGALFFCVTLILLAIIIYVMIHKIVIAKLVTLTNSSQRLSRGDDSVSVLINSDDEIGELSTSIDKLLNQLRQHSQASADSSARMEAILNTAAEGIITIGGDGKILSFNRAACDIFGYDANEIINEKVTRLFNQHNTNVLAIPC